VTFGQLHGVKAMTSEWLTVVRIENGHMSPTVAMLDKLAKALGITVRDLFPVEPRPHRRRRRV